jgi:hypothetical protein
MFFQNLITKYQCTHVQPNISLALHGYHKPSDTIMNPQWSLNKHYLQSTTLCDYGMDLFCGLPNCPAILWMSVYSQHTL